MLGPLGRLLGLRPPFSLTAEVSRDHHSCWGVSLRMAAMDGFDHILNWKLKEGSHPFPGKDGGTCINEAALVAAGFEYRPVRSVEDMPISRVKSDVPNSSTPIPTVTAMAFILAHLGSRREV